MNTFLEYLAQKQIINLYQIDSILEKSRELGGDIDKALVELEVSEEGIRLAKSEFYGVPEKVLDADNLRIESLSNISEDSARHYKSVAFGTGEDGVIEVGLVDPGNLEAKNALQFIFDQMGKPYRLFVISQSDFETLIDGYTLYGNTKDDEEESASDESAKSLEETLADAEQKAGSAEKGQKGTIIEGAPATKTVASILKQAIEGGVSDIHIEPAENSVRVRYRVDGDLSIALVVPKTLHGPLVARIKILAKLKLDEKRKPQDGRFPARLQGRKVDFRVSTMPTFFGEKVVIRILDPGRGVSQVDKTGMGERHVDLVRRSIKKPYGMILITGPTGSGKSTTLYAMLAELDKEKKNVISLEDPVEYNMDGVNQSQVHAEIGYTFANGLRSILRQDPDIIFVGEIRDEETARLAIQAALTGHLVLSTLHTNTSIGAIARLIDMGIEPYLIASTLIMVLAQRLVRTFAPGAAQELPLDGGKLALVQQQFNDVPQSVQKDLDLRQVIHEPRPDLLDGTGLKGRTAVFETFEVTKELERLIVKEATEQELLKAARDNGMTTMKEDAIIKCMHGKIPWSEINKL